MVTTTLENGSALILPPDVCAALQELARTSGQSFLLSDSSGRNLLAARGFPAPFGSVVGCMERSSPVRFPWGEVGRLSLSSPEHEWSAAHDAWLSAGVCLAQSALRMGAEAESMAAEIARTYEELSMLYAGSASLSSADDLLTTCEKTLRLATGHIPVRAAAIYVRERQGQSFLLSAQRGPYDFWAFELEPDPDLLPAHPAFSGRTLLTERATRLELLSMGASAACERSFLCAPLVADVADKVRSLGWLALYDRRGDDPFHSTDEKLASALAAQAAAVIANNWLVEERQDLLMGAIRSLASAVDAKDRNTHGHSRRVTDYALAVARGTGCPASQLDALELAGLLHDVGKIGVPDRILTKPGGLDDEEWKQMRQHPVIGSSIVDQVPGLHPFVREGIRSHHERFDGTGYPDGLASTAIPLAGRILSVADCFDAMTSNRPYRCGMNPEDAVRLMLAASGAQFDPEILSTFVQLFYAGEIRVRKE